MQTCSTLRPFSMTTIRSAFCAAPMSNHDGGALARHTIERLPPQSFALGVERGSRLIKQQHRCVLHDRARNSEALALTATERVTLRLPTDVSYPSGDSAR
jgi:hypothetical protein